MADLLPKTPPVDWSKIYEAFERDDSRALELLESHTRASAIAIARRALAGNRALSPEDAVQDSYLKVLNVIRHGSYPPKHIRPWYFCILRNTCIDHLRKSGRAINATSEGDIENLTPRDQTQDVLSATIQADLESWLDELPERERTVVLERVGRSCPVPEIATDMGLSHANVSTIRTRAITSLKRSAIRDGYMA